LAENETAVETSNPMSGIAAAAAQAALKKKTKKATLAENETAVETSYPMSGIAAAAAAAALKRRSKGSDVDNLSAISSNPLATAAAAAALSKRRQSQSTDSDIRSEDVDALGKLMKPSINSDMIHETVNSISSLQVTRNAIKTSSQDDELSKVVKALSLPVTRNAIKISSQDNELSKMVNTLKIEEASETSSDELRHQIKDENGQLPDVRTTQNNNKMQGQKNQKCESVSDMIVETKNSADSDMSAETITTVNAVATTNTNYAIQSFTRKTNLAFEALTERAKLSTQHTSLSQNTAPKQNKLSTIDTEKDIDIMSSSSDRNQKESPLKSDHMNESRDDFLMATSPTDRSEIAKAAADAAIKKFDKLNSTITTRSVTRNALACIRDIAAEAAKAASKRNQQQLQ